MNAPGSGSTSIQLVRHRARAPRSPRCPVRPAAASARPASRCAPDALRTVGLAPGYRTILISVAGSPRTPPRRRPRGCRAMPPSAATTCRPTSASAASHSAMTPGSSGSAARPLVGSLQPQIGLGRSAAACRSGPTSICSRQSTTPPVSSPPSRVYPRKCGLLTIATASLSACGSANSAPGRREHPLGQLLGHTVTGEMEEAHLVRHRAQPAPAAQSGSSLRSTTGSAV